MSSRRWPSTLRIPWPFRDHDDLEWHKNPLRVFIPALVGCTGKIRGLFSFYSSLFMRFLEQSQIEIILILNPIELLCEAFPELKNFQRGDTSQARLGRS